MRLIIWNSPMTGFEKLDSLVPHLLAALAWAWPFSRHPIADRTNNDLQGQ
jgi:hypothetical protein